MNYSYKKVGSLDRFIPARELVNFDVAYDKLNGLPELDTQSEMNASAMYKNNKRLELLRQLDKIARINERIFKISRWSSRENVHPSAVRLWPCNPRKKPMIQDEKVLDLPEFNCAFHLNPIDWGSNDCLATSVANKVLIGRNLDMEKVAKETVFEYRRDRSTAVSWSPDGGYLAFGSEFGLVLVLFVLKKRMVLENVCCLGKNCTVTVIQWHPDSSFIAWGCTRGRLSVRSTDNATVANVEKAHRGYVCGLKYSPTGNYLCSSGLDGFLRIWKGTSYDPYMEIEMANPSRAMAWHPWRTGLLAVGEGPPAPGSLSIWNVNTAELVFLKKMPPSTSITALSFNKITGELVFSQRVDGDGESRSEIFVLGGPHYVVDSVTNLPGTVFALVWNADSTKLGAASSDETFRIWKFLKGVKWKGRGKEWAFTGNDEDLNYLALKRFRSLIRKQKPIKIRGIRDEEMTNLKEMTSELSASRGDSPQEGDLPEQNERHSWTCTEPVLVPDLKRLAGSVYESLCFGAQFNGSMSLIRKYFCAFVFLDLLVHLFMYIIYLKHVQDYSLASLLGHQMTCYDIRTSFVDIVLLSVGRFLLLEYLYGGVRSRTWTGTTLTTALTSVFVIIKSLHYDWGNECRRAWLACLITLSFVSAWAEAFLVDFRLIGMEDMAENYADGKPETFRREIPRTELSRAFFPMTIALFRRI